MLMTVIFSFLVILLGGFIVLRLKRQNRQATHRRRHREPQIHHQMSEEPSDEMDADDALGLHQVPSLAPEGTEPAEEVKTPKAETQYITLHVMAPNEYSYGGYELLQALLANGLRYGDMHIFHRHEKKTGRGRVLFSLASVNKPGTFELSKMGSFSCPGLTLFMPLKDPDPMGAFDMMLEIARQLVEDLGGAIWDDQRDMLNMDKVAQIRSSIKHFEENQRMPDFFDEMQPE